MIVLRPRSRYSIVHISVATRNTGVSLIGAVVADPEDRLGLVDVLERESRSGCAASRNCSAISGVLMFRWIAPML